MSTAKMSRTFRKNLTVCLVARSFLSFRNALIFGLLTYWEEDMSMSADYNPDPSMLEAAYALVDLLQTSDQDLADVGNSSQDAGATTDTSRATDEA